MEHLKRYVAPALLCRLAKYERLHLQRCDDLKDLILFPSVGGTGTHWISHMLKGKTYDMGAFAGYDESRPSPSAALLALEYGTVSFLSYTARARDHSCTLEPGDVLLLDGVEMCNGLVHTEICCLALGRVQ